MLVEGLLPERVWLIRVMKIMSMLAPPCLSGIIYYN